MPRRIQRMRAIRVVLHAARGPFKVVYTYRIITEVRTFSCVQSVVVHLSLPKIEGATIVMMVRFGVHSNFTLFRAFVSFHSFSTFCVALATLRQLRTGHAHWSGHSVLL